MRKTEESRRRGDAAPSALRRAGLALRATFSIGLLAGGCRYDSEDVCGEHQRVFGDDVVCVCVEGYALIGNRCVACGDNEVVGVEGCVCAEGYSRPAAGEACAETAAAPGTPCDESSSCIDATFNHCQPNPTTGGYCTRTGCESDDDCAGGYACDMTATPSYCRRPPVGVGTPCESPSDCAESEATFCDTVMSHRCLVQDCSLSADDCFEGSACCDLSAFGVPAPLCLPVGACP